LWWRRRRRRRRRRGDVACLALGITASD